MLLAITRSLAIPNAGFHFLAFGAAMLFVVLLLRSVCPRQRRKHACVHGIILAMLIGLWQGFIGVAFLLSWTFPVWAAGGMTTAALVAALFMYLAALIWINSEMFGACGFCEDQGRGADEK